MNEFKIGDYVRVKDKFCVDANTFPCSYTLATIDDMIFVRASELEGVMLVVDAVRGDLCIVGEVSPSTAWRWEIPYYVLELVKAGEFREDIFLKMLGDKDEQV